MATSMNVAKTVKYLFKNFKYEKIAPLKCYSVPSVQHVSTSSTSPEARMTKANPEAACNPASKVPAVGCAGAAKAEKVNRAMIAYLERAEAHNAFINNEIAEYEIGKRHLATIMGVDPELFTQEDIDNAIEYLLPSGIFDRKARPKMKHPVEALPQKKAAQFGMDGRPFHCFFYTGKPNYAQALHDLSAKLEKLKALDTPLNNTLNVLHKPLNALESKASPPAEKLQLSGSLWLEKKEMETKFQETLSDAEYAGLVNLLEFMSQQTYALNEKDSIFEFRRVLQQMSKNKELEPVKHDDNGRVYQEAKGKRKMAEATVKLWEKGTGNIIVNGRTLLEYFPRLADREQILFPLHLTEKLGTVDVDAVVELGGLSGQAGAIRLALSIALQSFTSRDMVEKMRLAGLLTPDPRTVERQKPGQMGARRKYTWKKR